MLTKEKTLNGKVCLPTDEGKGRKAQRLDDGGEDATHFAPDHPTQTAEQNEEHHPQAAVLEEHYPQALTLSAAINLSIGSNDEVLGSDKEEGAPFSASERSTLKRKRKRRKAAEIPLNKDLANATIVQSNDSGGMETEKVSDKERGSESGGSGASSSNSSDHEESSLEEPDLEDGDGERRTDDSTAFGRAFQKIMKKKLPPSVLGEAMGPILSGHKQLMAKKLEEVAEDQKARRESKREKQALREKGHAVPAPYTASKDKDLIRLATRGVVKLFNAVSKAQTVQEGAKASRTTEAKEVARRSKSTFLAMLQAGNGSSSKGKNQASADKKDGMDGPQMGWSALQDTFMLGKSRLKDWDKKQDEGVNVEGIKDSDDGSDSE